MIHPSYSTDQSKQTVPVELLALKVWRIEFNRETGCNKKAMSLSSVFPGHTI